MGCLRFKDGVSLEPMAVGGAFIVAALARTAIRLPFDLTITSGADGIHSGATDPHKLGNAADVRSHDLTTAEKHSVLQLLMGYLGDFSVQITGRAVTAQIEETSGGLATEFFFGFLEHPNEDSEHFHIQTRRGRAFPPLPAMTRA